MEGGHFADLDGDARHGDCDTQVWPPTSICTTLSEPEISVTSTRPESAPLVSEAFCGST